MATYQDWNEAFQTHFFGPQARRPVYIALDDDTVERLWAQMPEGKREAGSGIEDFCQAVDGDVGVRGWLVDTAADNLGRCCLFVLGYSHVARRGSLGAPAYWQRVFELLGSGSLSAMGLTQDSFQEIWARARDAFPEIQLPVPSANQPRRWAGHFCNVRLVQSQAALRQLDLDRIETLLSEGQSGRELRRSESGDSAWEFVIAELSVHTAYAQRVLRDNRESARNQVLALWERIRTSRKSVREADSLKRASPKTLAFSTESREGLYLQLEKLREIWAFHACQQLSLLQLAQKLRLYKLWIFDDFLERYTPASAANIGDRILVFIEEGRNDDWLSALKLLSKGSEPEIFEADKLSGLPTSWILVQIRSVCRPQKPNPFAWILDTLHFEGGLRIGQGQWLLGAGPIAYAPGADSIEVDGSNMETLNGRVALNLLELGVHKIIYGSRFREVNIVPARRTTTSEPGVWIWPDGSGWPTYGRVREARSPALDGPMFMSTRSIDSERIALNGPAPAWSFRSPPTVRDLEYLLDHGRLDILRYAAIVRGRR